MSTREINGDTWEEFPCGHTHRVGGPLITNEGLCLLCATAARSVEIKNGKDLLRQRLRREKVVKAKLVARARAKHANSNKFITKIKEEDKGFVWRGQYQS